MVTIERRRSAKYLWLVLAVLAQETTRSTPTSQKATNTLGSLARLHSNRGQSWIFEWKTLLERSQSFLRQASFPTTQLCRFASDRLPAQRSKRARWTSTSQVQNCGCDVAVAVLCISGICEIVETIVSTLIFALHEILSHFSVVRMGLDCGLSSVSCFRECS